MTWRRDVPPTFIGEANKIKYELLPYVNGDGIELGCGPWKAFAHSIGIDGQRHPGPRGPQLVMDCTRFPMFADRAFDFVFSSHLLEHIVDTAATLAEWWRLVKIGGRLILYLPHKNFYPNVGEPGANPDHKHDFVPEDIRAIMRGLGGWSLERDDVRSEGYEYSFLQVWRKRDDDEQIIVDRPAAGTPACIVRTACVVRPGAYGDALLAASVCAGLREQGYRVTVMTEECGQEVLREDPNVDEILSLDVLPDSEWQACWDYFEPRFDRFINLCESVEKNLISVSQDSRFYWPDALRRQVFAGNYLEQMHAVAGVPYLPKVRFHETEAERDAAFARSIAWSPLIVVAVSGSTPPKFWPHVPTLVEALAKAGAHVVLLGDLRGLKIAASDWVHVIGTVWPMRDALALARQAAVVIGQETGLLNAVAFEPMRKVVLLSHSTERNLTRDWINTVALHGDVPCYPCHRIHFAAHDWKFCHRDETTGAAACQTAIDVEQVIEALVDAIQFEKAA